MSRKEQFYFGSILKKVDLYTFPRTGTHFFMYCFTGLFDTVMVLPDDLLGHSEAITRQDELDDRALYGLELREPGAPYQPIWLDPIKGPGFHQTPAAGPNPILITIRHPLAASYSAWRSRTRLTLAVETPAELRAHLDWYEKFYDAALQLAGDPSAKTLLIRFEDLVRSAEPLERVVAFLGQTPKLSPRFVHWITRFDSFVKDGQRTFYRQGHDEAWREDDDFVRLLAASGPPRDFRRFGYALDQATVAR